MTPVEIRSWPIQFRNRAESAVPSRGTAIRVHLGIFSVGGRSEMWAESVGRLKRMTAVVKFEVVGGYDEATGVGDGEQHQQIIGIGTKRDRGCVAHSAIMHI